MTYVAVYYMTLHGIPVHYITITSSLQYPYIASHYATKRNATQENTTQHHITLHNTTLHYIDVSGPEKKTRIKWFFHSVKLQEIFEHKCLREAAPEKSPVSPQILGLSMYISVSVL